MTAHRRGLIGLLLAAVVNAGAARIPEVDGRARKTAVTSVTIGLPNRTHFNINRIQTVLWYDGTSDLNAYRVGDAGLVYPKGSGRSCIYETGILWNARYGVGGEVRTGGSFYGSALRCGKILAGMVAEPDSLAKNRIYRVRPDIPPFATTANVSSERLDGEGADEDIYAQYHRDWLEWPWQDGAPFHDTDQNGMYDPGIDIPGIPGADQTLWYVANDLDASLAQLFWGSNPMGIEMQVTVWGYASGGGLGNVSFRRYLLMNKSSTVFDSMYVTIIVDPDVGQYDDDLVGCDTSRSMGFAYNGASIDRVYSPLPPPAVGFDLFQGPLVPGSPSDSAIFLGKRVFGKRNLPITAFYAFDYTSPDPSYHDPDWEHPNPLEIRNLLKGFTKYGDPWRDPAGFPSAFPFSGDPVTRNGWIDGQLFPKGDRRFGLASGPFAMAPGDTQEIVVAAIAAGAEQSVDRLTAVSLLKFYDDQAQQAYNNFFSLPAAPPAPKVTAAAFDREIILSWADDPAAVSATERATSLGYSFQGYNVYQLPSATSSAKEGIRLATYDIIDDVTKIRDLQFDPSQGEVVTAVRHLGTDSGLRRSLRLTTDPFMNDQRLVNGTTYHYAVTAYSYNPDPYAVPSSIENPITITSITPQLPDPGVRYTSAYGDTLTGISHVGPSSGRLIARVINPQAMKNAEYRIAFEGFGTTQVWHLVRTMGTLTDTVAKNQSDQTGDEALSPTADGILWTVINTTPDFKSFLVVSNASGPVSPFQQGCFAFGNNGFPLAPDGADRPDGTRQQSAGLLNASSGWGIHTGMSSPDMNSGYEFFLTRVTQAGARFPLIVPYDFEIRFTAAGGKALIPAFFGAREDLLIDVPFQLWSIGVNTPDDPSDDVRLFPYILDVDGNGQWNILTQAGVDTFDLSNSGTADHSVSPGANDPYTDWFYWVAPENTDPGQSGYDAIVASVAADIGAGRDPFLGQGTAAPDVMRRMVLVGWNFGDVATGAYPQQRPEEGTTFRIVTTKPNTPQDTFTITTASRQYSDDLARADVDQINVFPNPYYGVNPHELDKYRRFVTFSHLPPRATIRIFNLAGVMVRRIDKASSSQFEPWDLKNEDGLPVGSGMYIAHIEMPDLGTRKILKIAIVQEQQILDRY